LELEENTDLTGLDRTKFEAHDYQDRLFLDFNVQEHFEYSIDRVVFRYYDPLCSFLRENPHINLYLTNDGDVKNFEHHGNDLKVNIDDFISFCDNIGYSKKDKGRAKAFFGQHLSLSNINYSEADRTQFIKTNLTERDLLDKIKTLSEESQKHLIDTIIKLRGNNENSSKIVSSENFIKLFTHYLSDTSVQNSVLQNLPHLQIDTLKKLKAFISENLDKDESFFQNWIDEDKGKYRKQRCLIFGIEYIDPKREGEIMGRKRFDILATQNREYHVLIELKSPSADIFEVEEKPNQNDGYTTTYKLSKDLSRAIPQILGYKKWYQQLNPEKVKELGINKKKDVSECIIIIGQRKNDDEWKENIKSLSESLSIKIWTYNDLIDKMENTIQNLEENL
jgi:hypothetical protein